MAKKPIPVRGLISNDRVAKLRRWTLDPSQSRAKCGRVGARLPQVRPAWSAAMCQACTFGIKAAGNDGGASLGEVRGRHFFVAAHVHGHNAVLGSNGDGVGIAKHHRHARLPSALAIALRARGIAWAINIAEALWRTVAAVAVAEQLSSAAQVTVASEMPMLCRCSDGIGVNGNGGYQWSCADSAGGMAVPSSGFGYCWSL